VLRRLDGDGYRRHHVGEQIHGQDLASRQRRGVSDHGGTHHQAELAEVTPQ
jgi:hypothetical protein